MKKGETEIGFYDTKIQVVCREDNRIPASSSRRVEGGKRSHSGFPDGGP